MEQKILPVFQVFIICGLIFLLSVFFPTFTLDIPYKLEIFFALFMVAFGIAFSAVLTFKKHNTTVNPSKPETTSTIVSSGVFSFSRNPMYLGMLIFLSAVSIYSEHIFSPFLLALFVWFMTQYQIKPEEKILLSLFEDEYAGYLTKVRRWI